MISTVWCDPKLIGNCGIWYLIVYIHFPIYVRRSSIEVILKHSWSFFCPTLCFGMKVKYFIVKSVPRYIGGMLSQYNKSMKYDART